MDLLVLELGRLVHPVIRVIARSAADGTTYITVGGTLYFFMRKEDAEELLENLRKTDPLEGARVEETPAYQPFVYVLRSDVLKLLVIKEVRQKGLRKEGSH